MNLDSTGWMRWAVGFDWPSSVEILDRVKNTYGAQFGIGICVSWTLPWHLYPVPLFLQSSHNPPEDEGTIYWFNPFYDFFSITIDFPQTKKVDMANVSAAFIFHFSIPKSPCYVFRQGVPGVSGLVRGVVYKSKVFPNWYAINFIKQRCDHFMILWKPLIQFVFTKLYISDNTKTLYSGQ